MGAFCYRSSGLNYANTAGLVNCFDFSLQGNPVASWAKSQQVYLPDGRNQRIRTATITNNAKITDKSSLFVFVFVQAGLMFPRDRVLPDASANDLPPPALHGVRAQE